MQRSQSFEDDLRMIRIVGAKNLRKSTQGYLLLRARDKKLAVGSLGHFTPLRENSSFAGDGASADEA